MEKTASKGIFRLFSDSGGVLARQAQPLPQVLTCQFCSSLLFSSVLFIWFGTRRNLQTQNGQLDQNFEIIVPWAFCASGPHTGRCCVPGCPRLELLLSLSLALGKSRNLLVRHFFSSVTCLSLGAWPGLGLSHVSWGCKEMSRKRGAMS